MSQFIVYLLIQIQQQQFMYPIFNLYVYNFKTVTITLHSTQMANVSNGRRDFKVYDRQFETGLKWPTGF